MDVKVPKKRKIGAQQIMEMRFTHGKQRVVITFVLE